MKFGDHTGPASLLTSLALVAALTCGAPSRSAGQEAEPAVTAAAHAFLGVERCEACHQKPTQAYIDRGVTDFVALTESKVWLTDVHSQAYNLIDPAQSELSKQICDQLEIADISQAQQCLSCHSNWLTGYQRPPTYNRGVACESCHGPSEHWDVPHSREDWRARPVAEKESLGMVDVRNPVKRAEQCFSCHIGNAAEGKIVTHKMYAAGHPPLPSIEIESFAKQMPRHWRYLSEKPAFKLRDEFVRETAAYLSVDDPDKPGELADHNHAAAAVVLGGVVALRESIELLGDMTVQPKTVWPELSVLDCTACHHDLVSPAWRQDNPITLRPGRPSMHIWPSVLGRLGILHISPDRATYRRTVSQLDGKLAALHSEFAATPFGKPKPLQTASAALSKWLTDEVIAPVSAKPFDRRSLARCFKLLLQIGSTERHDYDSARQLAWALRTLYLELDPKPAADPQITELIDSLSKVLRLDLPHGKTEPLPIPDEPGAKPNLRLLLDGLSEAFGASAAYDPAAFQSRIQELRDMATPKPTGNRDAN